MKRIIKLLDEFRPCTNSHLGWWPNGLLRGEVCRNSSTVRGVPQCGTPRRCFWPKGETRVLISEELIIIVLSLILLVCSYGPLLYQYLLPPPGKVFLGTFGFPDDFFGNLISFQEGRLGHLKRFAKMTSTIVDKPSFIKIDYIILGQLSRLFPTDPVVFFHLARFILSIIFITLSYWLISKTFKKKSERLVAFSLAFFSTTLNPGRESLTDLWSPLQVFQRAAYYPHYLFSFIFILLAIYFLSKALTNTSFAIFHLRGDPRIAGDSSNGGGFKNCKTLVTKFKFLKLILASFFGFLAALIHPPVVIATYLGLPIYLVIVHLKPLWNRHLGGEILRHLRGGARGGAKLASLLVFCFLSSLPLLYLYRLSFHYPWNLLSRFDLGFNISSALSPEKFFIGIGPMAILAIIGSFLAIKKGKENTSEVKPALSAGRSADTSEVKKDWQCLLAPWSITYILGFFFIWKVIGYNSARFLQTPFFVFLGILSTFTLVAIAQRLAKKQPLNKENLLYLLVILVLLPNLPAYYQSFKDNLQNLRHFHPYIDSPIEKVEAINWLSQNTKENEIILSSDLNGMLIAALAGNMPYFTSHAWQLSEAKELNNNVVKFFSQEWSEKEVKEFTTREKIKLVFFGQEERSLAKDKYELDYPFLVKVFENSEATIYRIQL